MRANIRGFDIFKGHLDAAAQAALVGDVRRVAEAAPMFSPDTPYGKKMSVRMTSAGSVGWYADRSGYSYAPRHPGGGPWPPIPGAVLALWRELTGLARDPDCCLINYYGEGARMGMHQDKDEASFDWPVLSVSLGDAGLFRIGNATRGGKTESIWLESGDVVVMGGAARLTYHGVDRIRFGSSTLLPKGGRINLTCRVVF
ncbi:alpha-ketoglutarate-dependent dioxygenase AlkB [uncultured Tateyamaria sp.]|uniref:alpha-ketoglutarate-dependent dioxygenase AlkB family protein n=1 Tax=uncultured Tateyamaria sp. TaxID=455651 RepID=UPI0026388ABF|nr:alpha-ketoglutarate-dependent dioxygenase AlkB [uncultured Tateyamaria sp.]